MIKKLKQSKDCYLQFSEDELVELGIKKGDKFSAKTSPDGSIILTPFVNLEIDISDFSREILEFLISESCEKDISINEVISDSIRKGLNLNEDSI